jgi:hypothetical protein
MTLKLEYLHADLGTGLLINPPVMFSPGLTAVTRNVRLTNDIVRVGLNWKFGWFGCGSPKVPALTAPSRRGNFVGRLVPAVTDKC